MEALCHLTQEPSVLQRAEERDNHIIDADHSAADIEHHVASLKHLSSKEKQLLLKVLSAHTDLFKEGLGLLNIPPVELEVKEGAQPFHVKPFPLPHACERPAKKEIDRFCEIGAMDSSNRRRKGMLAA